MRKFQRLASPGFLAERWEQWGLEWERRHAATPGAAFDWHEVDGEPVNHKLLPTLKAQVQDHCSFCDAYPVSPPSRDTIEHFRPKAQFPREAYKWANLYYCCDFCQSKGGAFDEAVLQPDAEDYEFSRFFHWDFTTGTLEINKQASPANQKRASKSLEIYRLNIGHPLFRRMEAYNRSQMPTKPLDQFAYRDFVDAPRA